MIKLSNGLSKFFAVLMGLFTSITIACTLLTYNSSGTYFSCTSSDPVHLLFLYGSIFAGGVMIAFGLLMLFKLINRLSEKALTIVSIVLFVLYGAGLVFVLINFVTIPMTDSFYVHDEAISLVKGSQSQINGNSVYFGKYSNNNPMVIVLFFIYKIADILGITDYLTVGRIVNTLCLFIAEILFFLAIGKITGKKSTSVKFLLVSCLYPPVFFMVPWVYTATFCMPFMGGILLAGAHLIKAESKVKIAVLSAVTGVLTIIGYRIRPVVMILSIAFFICLVIWTIRDKKRLFKTLTIFVICAVFAGGSLVVTGAIEKHYYSGSDRVFPMTHWVAMGLTDSGRYDTHLVATHEKIAKTQGTEGIKKHTKEYINKTLSDYTPATFITHLFLKHGNIWGDGTLEYISRMAGCTDTPKIAKYIYGSKGDIAFLYCQMFWMALQILCLIFAIRFIFNKQKKVTLVLMLTMVGAYGFYMLWEVKPAYATPFIFLVIAMAVLGGEGFEERFAIAKPKIKNTGRIIFGTVALFSLILMIIGYDYCTQNLLKAKDYVFRVSSVHNGYIENVAKDKKDIVQTFETNKSFDRCQVYSQQTFRGDPGVDAVYTITLYNKDNRVIAQKTVDSAIKPENAGDNIRPITLKFDRYKPKGKEMFKLTITSDGTKDGINFAYAVSHNIDPYNGELYVGDNHPRGDLRIVLKKTHEAALIRPSYYIALCIGLVLAELLTYLIVIELPLKRKNNKENSNNKKQQ